MSNTIINLFNSAALDKPSTDNVKIVDGWWQVIITGRAKWQPTCALFKIPSTAEQIEQGDKLIVRWRSLADEFFGAGGILSKHLPHYEPRHEQVQMARIIQRAIELGVPAVAEAGTGVGKSFAYLAMGLMMNKRVLVATSNKALQMQLYEKDVPFLQRIFPNKRVSLAQGARNYVCLENVQQNGMPSAAFNAWLKTTQTGSIEELPFNLENPSKYTVDEECTGKRCGHFANCFLFHAKRQRKEADVIITNHSLLALNHHFPGAQILPDVDVVVVDEAHQFPDYVRSALGIEYHAGLVTKKLGAIWSKDQIHIGEAEARLDDFQYEVTKFIGKYGDKQIALAADQVFKAGTSLAQELRNIASAVFPMDADVIDKEDRKKERRAAALRSLAAKIYLIASGTREGEVRWIDIDTPTITAAPFDVSKFIGSMVDNRFPDDDDELDAEIAGEYDDEDEVGGESAGNAVHIFTSATLATPTLVPFLKECGITTAFQAVLQSPFDYKKNALLYVPTGGTPPPTDEKFIPYLIDAINQLVHASQGGAFVLFTSWVNMNKCLTQLRTKLERNFTVYVQGELPKMEIIKRFKSDPKAVLFATKSFWEGVDIPGNNLRMVILDKMPFPALTPMLKAREQTVANGFFDLMLPLMITDLKQGVGRAIRSGTDRAVIAILDPRIRTKAYGRANVLSSLPPAPVIGTTGLITEFFSDLFIKEPLPDLTKRVELTGGHDIDRFFESEAEEDQFTLVF